MYLAKKLNLLKLLILLFFSLSTNAFTFDKCLTLYTSSGKFDFHLLKDFQAIESKFIKNKNCFASGGFLKCLNSSFSNFCNIEFEKNCHISFSNGNDKKYDLKKGVLFLDQEGKILLSLNDDNFNKENYPKRFVFAYTEDISHFRLRKILTEKDDNLKEKNKRKIVKIFNIKVKQC